MKPEQAEDYFRLITEYRMNYHYLPKLLTCIESLNQQQLWEAEPDRQDEGANSIGGIVLHILEQIRRHLVKLSNPDADFDVRLSDYFPAAGTGPEQLMKQVEQTFLELKQKLAAALPFDMFSLYHLAEHTSYHLGQIIDRSQRLAGRKYQFVQNGINESQLRSLVEARWSEIGQNAKPYKP